MAVIITTDNGNKPAAPTGQNQSGTGLTKREYFAGLAMQGMLANEYAHDTKYERLAEYATQQADALLAELAKEK